MGEELRCVKVTIMNGGVGISNKVLIFLPKKLNISGKCEVHVNCNSRKCKVHVNCKSPNESEINPFCMILMKSKFK
jgi:hypothetical protein